MSGMHPEGRGAPRSTCRLFTDTSPSLDFPFSSAITTAIRLREQRPDSTGRLAAACPTGA